MYRKSALFATSATATHPDELGTLKPAPSMMWMWSGRVHALVRHHMLDPLPGAAASSTLHDAVQVREEGVYVNTNHRACHLTERVYVRFYAPAVLSPCSMTSL